MNKTVAMRAALQKKEKTDLKQSTLYALKPDITHSGHL